MLPDSDPLRRPTIREFLTLFGEIHSAEDFHTKLEEAELRLGRSEIVNDLVTWKIDADKVYLWENCSSTYALLGQHRFGSLPHEKSSIHGALKRAEALIELTGPRFHLEMLAYLERKGPSSGKGIFEKDGTPAGFSLDDFAFHKTKLIPTLGSRKIRCRFRRARLGQVLRLQFHRIQEVLLLED
jgi:hypothetical protein